MSILLSQGTIDSLRQPQTPAPDVTARPQLGAGSPPDAPQSPYGLSYDEGAQPASGGYASAAGDNGLNPFQNIGNFAGSAVGWGQLDPSLQPDSGASYAQQQQPTNRMFVDAAMQAGIPSGLQVPAPDFGAIGNAFGEAASRGAGAFDAAVNPAELPRPQFGRTPESDSLFTAGPAGEVVGPTGNVSELRLGREPVMGEDVNAGLRRTAYGRAQQEALAAEEQAAFRDAGDRAISGANPADGAPPLGGGDGLSDAEFQRLVAKKAGGESLTPDEQQAVLNALGERMGAIPATEQAAARDAFYRDPANLGGGQTLNPEQQANLDALAPRAAQSNTIRDSLANARAGEQPLSRAEQMAQAREEFARGQGAQPSTAPGGDRLFIDAMGKATDARERVQELQRLVGLSDTELAKGMPASAGGFPDNYRSQLNYQLREAQDIQRQADFMVNVLRGDQPLSKSTALDSVIARNADTLPEPTRTQPPAGYLDRFRQPPAGGAAIPGSEPPMVPQTGVGLPPRGGFEPVGETLGPRSDVTPEQAFPTAVERRTSPSNPFGLSGAEQASGAEPFPSLAQPPTGGGRSLPPAVKDLVQYPIRSANNAVRASNTVMDFAALGRLGPQAGLYDPAAFGSSWKTAYIKALRDPAVVERTLQAIDDHAVANGLPTIAEWRDWGLKSTNPDFDPGFLGKIPGLGRIVNGYGNFQRLLKPQMANTEYALRMAAGERPSGPEIAKGINVASGSTNMPFSTDWDFLFRFPNWLAAQYELIGRAAQAPAHPTVANQIALGSVSKLITFGLGATAAINALGGQKTTYRNGVPMATLPDQLTTLLHMPKGTTIDMFGPIGEVVAKTAGIGVGAVKGGVQGYQQDGAAGAAKGAAGGAGSAVWNMYDSLSSPFVHIATGLAAGKSFGENTRTPGWIAGQVLPFASDMVLGTDTRSKATQALGSGGFRLHEPSANAQLDAGANPDSLTVDQQRTTLRHQSWAAVQDNFGPDTKGFSTYFDWYGKQERDLARQMQSAGMGHAQALAEAQKALGSHPIVQAYTDLHNQLEDQWAVSHPEDALKLLDTEADMSWKDKTFTPSAAVLKALYTYPGAQRHAEGTTASAPRSKRIRKTVERGADGKISAVVEEEVPA